MISRLLYKDTQKKNDIKFGYVIKFDYLCRVKSKTE